MYGIEEMSRTGRMWDSIYIPILTVRVRFVGPLGMFLRISTQQHIRTLTRTLTKIIKNDKQLYYGSSSFLSSSLSFSPGLICSIPVLTYVVIGYKKIWLELILKWDLDSQQEVMESSWCYVCGFCFFSVNWSMECGIEGQLMMECAVYLFVEGINVSDSLWWRLELETWYELLLEGTDFPLKVYLYN